MSAIVPFQYDGLDVETREFVYAHTVRIRGLMQRSAEDIVAIGISLQEVKECLPHGQFGAWLEAEFAMSDRMARHFMLVAERFKTENFSDLSIAPSALYLLAAPSTPDEAIDEALERAEQGEVITHSTAQEIVDEHKPEPSEEPDDQFGPPQERYATVEEIDSGIEGVRAWQATPVEGAPLPEAVEGPELRDDDTDEWMASVAAGEEHDHASAAPNPYHEARDLLIEVIPRIEELLARAERECDEQDRREARFLLSSVKFFDLPVEKATLLRDRPGAMAYLRDELSKADTLEDLVVIRGELSGLRVGSREADAIIDAFQQDVEAKRRKLEQQEQARQEVEGL